MIANNYMSPPNQNQERFLGSERRFKKSDKKTHTTQKKGGNMQRDLCERLYVDAPQTKHLESI